jgi:FkbM family methyltransferase
MEVEEILTHVWRQLHCSTRSTGRLGDAPARFADLFHALCLSLKPTAFLEVGAHEASMAKQITASLPETEVFAFEANPFVWEHFAPAMPSAVRYLQSAVGSEVGSEQLLIPREIRRGRASRTLPRANSTASFHARAEERARYEQITVPCTTIDDFVESVSTLGPMAIWVDAEGATREVLYGGRATLAEHVVLACIELEGREVWDGEWLDHQVCGFMKECGFIPIVRDAMVSWQYNQIFLASSCLNEAILGSIGNYVDALIQATFDSGPRK